MTKEELLNALKPTFKYELFPTRSLGLLLMLCIFDHPSDFGMVRKSLGLKPSAMSRLMQGLHIRGLARRDRSALDGRRVFLSPTAAGRAFIKQLLEAA